MEAQFRNINQAQLLALFFFAAAGIVLLATLPLSGYPPHLGFLGIVSLITAYSFFTKRPWAPWLAFILLVTNSVFGFYTVIEVGLSNASVSLLALVYALGTWAVALSLYLKRRD